MGIFTVSCSFDSSGLSVDSGDCGNGILDEGEQCDGVIIPETCEDRGFTGGVTGCDRCVVDVTACTSLCGECTVGETRCLDNAVFGCVDFGGGCGTWQQSLSCDTTGEYCQIGDSGAICSVSCQDQCAEGETACAPNLSAIEGCTGQVVDSAMCLVWRTIDACGVEESCRPMDGQPECVATCGGQCVAGEEQCSEDGLSRLVCVADTSGCTSWEEVPCTGDQGCVETGTGMTECSCALCEVGTEACSGDLTAIMTCQSSLDGCSQWEVAETCSAEEYEFCSSQGATASCARMGDTCASVYPVASLPYQVQFTDFTSNFSNSISLSDPSCGGSLANSNDVAFEIQLNSGDTVRVVKLSGLDVSIKILRTCTDASACIAYGDNDVTFTVFETGTYIVVVERRGTGTGDLILGITYGESLCTDAEEEPNEDFTESNPYPGPHAVWCSSITPGTDSDCVTVEIGATGYFFEAFTTDIYDAQVCPGDTYLTFHDQYGNILAQNDDSGLDGVCSSLSPAEDPALMDLVPGIYHLCVHHATHATSIPAVATHMDVITDVTGFVSEDFELFCPPAGWEQVLATPSSPTWSCASMNGGRIMSASIETTDQADLLTQSIDVSTVTTLLLSMDHQLDAFNTGTVIKGTISIKPEGQSEILVWTGVNDINPMTPFTLDLSPYIVGLSHIQILFRLEANIITPMTGNWMIDNVRIVGY